MILINVKSALLFFPFMAIYFFVTFKKQPKSLRIINSLIILLIFCIATYQNLNAVPNEQYYELVEIAQQQKGIHNKEINVSWVLVTSGFGTQKRNILFLDIFNQRLKTEL